MHREINRLLSTRSYIHNDIQLQNAILLARNGFYVLEDEAFACSRCNWCDHNIFDWLHAEITIRHRRGCAFFEDNLNCGNIPLTVPAEQVLSSADATTSAPALASIELTANMDFKNEAVRLETFKNWPNPYVTPQSLAKAGFYYFNYSDHVKCAWCKGVIAKWEEGDNAFQEHRRFFPACPLVEVGPLIEIAHRNPNGLQNLGIQQICPPKSAKFSTLDSRMRTYSNWPIPDIQKAEVLAQAGFFYQNIDDQVRCFHCNGGLRSWQKEDDPWFEHAKWFPYCQFVKLAKGPLYVSQVQETGNQSGTENNVREANTVTQIEQVVTLDDAMLTDPVRQALEMGLNAGRIRIATRQQLENSGKPYDTTEELVEAVLESAEEEYQHELGEHNRSLMREVSRMFYTMFNPRSTEAVEGVEEVNAPNDQHEEDHTTCTTVPERTVINTIPTNSTINTICDTLQESAAPITAQPSTSSMASSASSSTIQSFDIASTSRSAGSDVERQLKLEEENRQLKDARLCKVCMDDEVGVVFVPCGHLVTCVQCAPGVTQCPLCRSTIKGFVRTFLS